MNRPSPKSISLFTPPSRRQRIIRSLLRSVRPGSLLTMGALLASSVGAQAATGTWNNPAATGDWSTGPWGTGTPGVSGISANTDTATFSTQGTVAHAVSDTTATNRSLGALAFGGAGLGGNYTVGTVGNTFYLNNTTNTVTSTSSNTSTVVENLMLTGAVAAFSSSSTGTLTLSGALSTSAASGNTQLSLGASGSGLIVLSGAVQNGASATVGLTRTSTTGGIVNLAGANTFTSGFISGSGSNNGNVTQIGVNSVGSVGSITSGAFGKGTLSMNGGVITSDGTTARTIYNTVDVRSGVNGFGDSVNNGTLTFAGALTFSTGLNSTMQANSAVDFTNTTTTTGNNQTLILSGASNGSIAAGLGTNITGLTKSGTGTWTLSGASTSTAAPTINDGTLKMGVNNAIKSSNNLSVIELTASGTATLDLGGFNQQLNILTLGGTGASASGTNQVINSSGTSSTLTVNGITTSATNNPLGSLISVNLLDLGAGSRTFNIADSTNAAADLTISSVIQNGSLIKSGAGTLVLSGASTYTGTTSINAGVLSVNKIKSVSGGASALGAPTTGANGTIAIGATTVDATLVYTGTGDTTDRIINLAGTTGGATLDQSGTGLLKFTSNFTNAGAAATDVHKTVTLQGSTAGKGEIAGVIADAVSGTAGLKATSLTKAGTGTWVLSGANAFSGATSVLGGNLQLMSAVTSTTSSTGTGIVTESGGLTTTLSGTGGAKGAVTVTNGSRIAPGVNTSGANTNFGSAGTLALGTTGGLTLTDVHLDFDLGTLAASSKDLLTTGSLSLGTLAFTFNGLGSTLDTSTGYILIDASSVSGFNVGNITTTYLGVIDGLYTATYSINGSNDLVVNFNAAVVPEPGTWAMMLGGLALLVVLQRRRQGD